MRQFIVLGFPSNSRQDPGESLYLGGNRGDAIAAVNEPDDRFARKAMYELAQPHMSRHFAKPQPVETDSVDDVETDPVDDVETDSVEMTDSARELADEFELTDEQVSQIEATGQNGKILKGDVEDFIETLGTD